MRLLIGLLLLAGAAFTQTDELVNAMRAAETAWNRGDLQAFVRDYDDSPETTFIGREVTRGNRQAILERYRRGYPTRERMGVLSYSDLDVRIVADGVAIMTGRFALKRDASAGGDSSGRFTLVWRRTPAGWKIVHDHTSS
jgi:ketosteroid isomerase-like protein